jgi:hypothetical protein
MVVPIFSSGGYDHGTSTGKGQLELDFTWNPFNIFEYGQTYIVGGYGLTKYLDIHGYYSYTHTGINQYYLGLFYQFADTKYLDLATAIGGRIFTEDDSKYLFFPQLLYNTKLTKYFTIGGAFVRKYRHTNNSLQSEGTALDIFITLPLSNFFKLPKKVHEIKFALGLFDCVLFDPDVPIRPTYSIDLTFKKFGKIK